jgi:hypothetical protein
MDKEEFSPKLIKRIVLSYLIHYGYKETAKVLNKDNLEINLDKFLYKIEERKSIYFFINYFYYRIISIYNIKFIK